MSRNDTKLTRLAFAVLVLGMAILFIDQPWSRAQQQSSGGQSVTINGSLPAGSAVIGHVIADSGSTTAVTGNVTVTQGTASNLKVDLSGTAANGTAIKVDNSAVTQPVSGTVTVGTLPALVAGSAFVGYSRAPNACGTTAYEATMQYPPTASTQLTATATCVDTIYINNTTGTAATISIQDQSTACNSAACQVLSSFSVPANSNLELPLHGMKFVSGIKWSQGTSNALMVDIIGNQ
jgi:hypothetical protein